MVVIPPDHTAVTEPLFSSANLLMLTRPDIALHWNCVPPSQVFNHLYILHVLLLTHGNNSNRNFGNFFLKIILYVHYNQVIFCRKGDVTVPRGPPLIQNFLRTNSKRNCFKAVVAPEERTAERLREILLLSIIYYVKNERKNCQLFPPSVYDGGQWFGQSRAPLLKRKDWSCCKIIIKEKFCLAFKLLKTLLRVRRQNVIVARNHQLGTPTQLESIASIDVLNGLFSPIGST